MPPSSDARPLVYHSNDQALSTPKFRRAGQLATADTCFYRATLCYSYATAVYAVSVVTSRRLRIELVLACMEAS